MIFKAYPF
uniref:Uncharacterized protein n=1 Tax=Medicago truncatula TaxID=3880 RepID=I3T6X9_MEDTR|nr:unknown [Medicago truncatula]